MTDWGSQVELAKGIATIAHTGQVDKLGAPYIEHPARVAARLSSEAWYVIAAAWLHDVVEDTQYTLEDLRLAGINSTVCSIVETLTHQKGVSNEDYWKAIRSQGWGAKKVKLADIADNTDVRRLSHLDDATALRLMKKYARALTVIVGEVEYAREEK